MSAVIDWTESQALAALRAFLLSVLPAGAAVVRGQQNGVPMPLGSFVVMTPITAPALHTPVRGYDRSAGLSKTTQGKDWRVQLDVYGPDAFDSACLLATVLRSPIATEFFGAQGVPMQALYAEEPRNLPFINESSNYENRWTLDIHLQVNQTVSVPQQFATALAVGLHEVDQTFAP